MEKYNMKSVSVKMICRFLIVSVMMLSFNFANAGMIGADQVATAGAQSERAAVMSVLSRSEVASQMQALGLDSKTAKDRVAAMSDNEVLALNGQLGAVPAGADGGLLLLIVVGVLVWWFFWKR
jgi:hypothetical protein